MFAPSSSSRSIAIAIAIAIDIAILHIHSRRQAIVLEIERSVVALAVMTPHTKSQTKSVFLCVAIESSQVKSTLTFFCRAALVGLGFECCFNEQTLLWVPMDGIPTA